MAWSGRHRARPRHAAPRRTRHGYDRVKRALDVVAAVAALVVAAPVMAVVAVLVWATVGRPVLFRQPRAGRHGRPFRMVKFRTMRPADPSRGLVTDADRLPAVGRVLRSTSLDELPTLWHVLRGQMSLVGPRPLLVSYLDRYTARQARRHEVRPGVTGLAQVRGRNAVAWQRRLALDVWYVDHRGCALDLRILRATVALVLRRRGIGAAGQVTMPEFDGDRAASPREAAIGGRSR